MGRRTHRGRDAYSFADAAAAPGRVAEGRATGSDLRQRLSQQHRRQSAAGAGLPARAKRDGRHERLLGSPGAALAAVGPGVHRREYLSAG